MTRTAWWIAFILPTVLYSTVAVLLFRGQRARVAVIILGVAFVAMELAVMVIRARAQGSPFSWEEPQWVSLAAVAVPLLAGATVAGWPALRGWSVLAHVLVTIAAALVAGLGGGAALYAHLAYS